MVEECGRDMSGSGRGLQIEVCGCVMEEEVAILRGIWEVVEMLVAEVVVEEIRHANINYVWVYFVLGRASPRGFWHLPCNHQVTSSLLAICSQSNNM